VSQQERRIDEILRKIEPLMARRLLDSILYSVNNSDMVYPGNSRIHPLEGIYEDQDKRDETLYFFLVSLESNSYRLLV